MKNLLKILIILTFFAIIFYYTNASEDFTEPLKSSTNAVQPIPKIQLEHDGSNYLPRPNSGVSMYIGKDDDVLIQNIGKPTRVDSSGFGYDWWIYLKETELQMYGIKEGIIKQVYTNSSEIDVSPYKVDQSIDDIYRITPLESEIIVEVDENVYLFMMNQQDMKTRIIVPFEGVFAQLYIDAESKTLAGIRYMDQDILLLHQPYEYQYFGEMLPKITVNSLQQYEIDLAHANQVYDLINEYRAKNNVIKLMKNVQLSEIAKKRSESLYISEGAVDENYEVQSLQSYLEESGISYKSYDENIAYYYYDAIEAYHGWINSEAHRKNIQMERYTFSGTGVYMGYYTQVFIEKEFEVNEKK